MPNTELIEQFDGLKALVIGDVMLDAYAMGVIERMSPEAPVPIVNVNRRFMRLGGAANVALNLKSLGAIPTVCSVVGDDQPGKELVRMFGEEDLSVEGIIHSHNRVTTVKHRIFNGDKQVLRVDEEDCSDLSQEEQTYLFHLIDQLLKRHSYDIIVLQDYNKGVLTAWMIENIIALAKSLNIPVAVDPKKKNFFAYQGVTLFKPNAKELRDGLDVDAETIETLHKTAMQLKERLHCQYLMVTLSERGVLILDDSQVLHLPAHPRTIVDVSGAGDTVLSVAALCVALRRDTRTIASLSNLAGGLVCETVGVTPISKEQLKHAMELFPNGQD